MSSRAAGRILCRTIRGLICGVLHFFYSRIDELSELSGYSLFLSLLPRRLRGQKPSVCHTLLEGDLAQDHIPVLVPMERSLRRERDGADRNAVTALKVLIVEAVEGDDALTFPSHVPISYRTVAIKPHVEYGCNPRCVDFDFVTIIHPVLSSLRRYGLRRPRSPKKKEE